MIPRIVTNRLLRVLPRGFTASASKRCVTRPMLTAVVSRPFTTSATKNPSCPSLHQTHGVVDGFHVRDMSSVARKEIENEIQKLYQSASKGSQMPVGEPILHRYEAFDILVPQGYGSCFFGKTSPILFTAEHASNRLPDGYDWSKEDHHLAMKHWAVDLGTRDLTHILSRKSNCHALLSRFSRLLVDCNRPVSSSTLMRKDADHEKVLLNADISDKDLHHRLNEYYYPYHEAMQVLCRHPEIHLVCSIHSFTPSYEGRKREVEIGVLYDGDHNKQLAEVVTKRFSDLGYDARVNDPWSGLDGFMYSAGTTTEVGKRNSLMFEFRQDLLVDEKWRNNIATSLLDILSTVRFN